MSIQTLGRCGVTLFLAALISACSSTSPRESNRSDECGASRSKCMYEGAYEPGEQGYAEMEAKRLNQAESQRMRRSFGR
jgi:hypothetical protein